MELLEHLLERVRAIPGVQSATLSSESLISNSADINSFVPNGIAQLPGSEEHPAYNNQVGSDFFKTIGIPILAGRAIDERDRGNSPKVAVVNRALARRFFGKENPIGRTFNKDQIRIVGVCGDAHYSNVRDEVPPTFYYPFLQDPDPDTYGEMTFELRTAADPRNMIAAVRDAVASVDKDVPPYEIRTQEQQIDANISKERVFAALTTLFSALALLLSCIGIYGIMAYTVSRRTNEIGIRMALGAQRGAVLSMILREASLVGVAGVAIGLAAALAATRILAGLLYGLKPQDPLTLTFAAILMLLVTATASLIPARRASRVEPTVALRYE
jgi:predicted permease